VRARIDGVRGGQAGYISWDTLSLYTVRREKGAGTGWVGAQLMICVESTQLGRLVVHTWCAAVWRFILVQDLGLGRGAGGAGRGEVGNGWNCGLMRHRNVRFEIWRVGIY
jgi:hypothetical protein